MSVNRKRLVELMMEQISGLEERCPGYRKELTSVLAEIITLEQQNLTHGTNIRQRIADKCDALGKYLASKRK